MSEWLYEGKPIEELPKCAGFVYRITNLLTGRKYIGKKVASFKKTKQKKGKKIRYEEESDWKSYYGSSDELASDIERLGKDEFRREILVICKSKGEMSYVETKLIFETDALLREDYYNSWVMCRVRKAHLKSLWIPLIPK